MKCHCGFLTNVPAWEHDFFLRFYCFHGEIDAFLPILWLKQITWYSLVVRKTCSFIVKCFFFHNIVKKTAQSFLLAGKVCRDFEEMLLISEKLLYKRRECQGAACVGSCDAVSVSLSERMVAGLIPTISDFHTVGPCKKAVFACFAIKVKQDTFTSTTPWETEY